jgi:hypothetical protein
MRIGVVALVVAVAAGLLSTSGDDAQPSGAIAASDGAAITVPAVVASTDSLIVTKAPARPERAASVPPKVTASERTTIALAPVVGPGRTDVGDGLYIERAGDSVTVHFDTPETRTRRRDKFERVVRRTLPEVYGSAAEVLLSSIPEGTLVESADLVTEIAERGVELDAGDGWKFALWPETRPGQDGPLVVSYRVAITR